VLAVCPVTMFGSVTLLRNNTILCIWSASNRLVVTLRGHIEAVNPSNCFRLQTPTAFLACYSATDIIAGDHSHAVGTARTAKDSYDKQMLT